MGGPSKAFKKLINTAEQKKIIKSVEQPKVKSQMDNTDIKSKDIVADKMAPTDAETSLRNKRKGRSRTIMTSVTGVDDYATLSKKSLLGG